jgi:uncharacterized LabA/DUF88 family protein
MTRVDPPHRAVKVFKTEEKGSDVNLAVDLLADGYNGRYERAVVISNDSDLARAIRIVRQDLKLPVVIINPYPQSPSKELNNIATHVRHIRRSALEKSQFPRVLTDERGTFFRPGSWG